MKVEPGHERKALSQARVQLWVPDLFAGTGGIQVFSQHFLRALCEVVPARQLQVLVKNDARMPVAPMAEFGHYQTAGTWPSFLRTPRFALEGLALTWGGKPRLIVSTHLHFGPLARLIKQFRGVPYVLVAHGIDAWRLDNRQRARALCEADLVMAVSRYTRDWLVECLGLAPERLRILPNTFAPERFIPRPKSPRLLAKYGFSEQTPIILMVCRLAEVDRYKGYDQVIEALPAILRELPETRFLLVGTGPDRGRIEGLIAAAGVAHAVVFAGFVPDDELVDHYNLCDLFAMPSKAEGFGIVYLEALACGKPVLAGNQDGSRDALADGELGLLVDPDNITEIAREALRVLRREHPHPHLFQQEWLRQRTIELFGFEAFKRNVADCLRPFLD